MLLVFGILDVSIAAEFSSIISSLIAKLNSDYMASLTAGLKFKF
jgi:hypothetical protein